MSDFKAKCTKFDFGWAPPQTPLGRLQRSPYPVAGIKGAASRHGGEGKGKGRGEGEEEDVRGRERKGRDGGGNGKS